MPVRDLSVFRHFSLCRVQCISRFLYSIRQNKVGGWLKGFTKPSKVITPLNVMELAIRPLSLCMRLFGNVMGAFVVMKLLEHLVPVILPAVFSCISISLTACCRPMYSCSSPGCISRKP